MPLRCDWVNREFNYNWNLLVTVSLEGRPHVTKLSQPNNNRQDVLSLAEWLALQLRLYLHPTLCVCVFGVQNMRLHKVRRLLSSRQFSTGYVGDMLGWLLEPCNLHTDDKWGNVINYGIWFLTFANIRLHLHGGRNLIKPFHWLLSTHPSTLHPRPATCSWLAHQQNHRESLTS